VKRPQWITAGITLLLAVALYAGTQSQFFGQPKPFRPQPGDASVELTIDSLLLHVKEHLTPDQVTRLNFLENNINLQKEPAEKLHAYHRLATFWRDSISITDQHETFEPFAWYTAEAARLENSEKSLTFAARLFWSSAGREADEKKRKWKALQTKDLLERSLKVNPANDSVRVELGQVFVYGNIGELPMKGIGMIREVAEEKPSNVYAQKALGYASLNSGQFDKAIGRFERVLELEPSSPETHLLLADIYERTGKKKEAIQWYRKSLPLVSPEIKREVEQRIQQLNK
jgi:tetratricopeptide (TPR) repeat protein